MRLVPFVLALLLTASLGRAATLDSIRKSLGELRGTAPIEATMEVQSDILDDEETRQTRGSCVLEQRGSDFRLRYSAPDLLRAGGVGGRANRGYFHVDSFHAFGLINFGHTLLHMLDGATITRQGPATWKGKPVTAVELRLAPPPDNERKYVKSSNTTLTLWLEADGIPLAGERQEKIKGRFLLFSFEAGEHTSYEIARVGDRLIVTREESTGSGSAMGKASKNHTISVLTVRG